MGSLGLERDTFGFLSGFFRFASGVEYPLILHSVYCLSQDASQDA
jgi:hypothetical protein